MSEAAIVLIVVLEDGETYADLDGCMILEVDSAALVSLQNGETVGRLVESGQARLVGEFVDGRLRSMGRREVG